MGKNVLSYAKYFHCSCHATWLPFNTSIRVYLDHTRETNCNELANLHIRDDMLDFNFTTPVVHFMKIYYQLRPVWNFK